MSLTTRQMSDKHEDDIAFWFGGRKTRGSGNQWRDPSDGRQNRRVRRFSFAWDGKSTRAKTITIKREDLDKLKEQAVFDRPMMPIRFYDDDRLRSFEDWVLVRVDDLIELTEAAEDE